MTSSKQEFLHTHVIEKGENIKMSARESEYVNAREGEKQMVARVRG